MLLRTVIIALVGSLAAAAPAASVVNSSPTTEDTAIVLPEGTEAIKMIDTGDIQIVNSSISNLEGIEAQLGARDSAGFAIRCFFSDNCQGTEVRSSGDLHYPSGIIYAIHTNVPYGKPISCRFDAWSGWSGELKIVEAFNVNTALKNGGRDIAGPKSIYGSGQLCLRGMPTQNQAGGSMGAVALARRY
ncbi:uncharacterized protein LOC62_02G002299 [Vanrija pseudolonga]|uniref:Ecp2 effector protein domain-containing protein n=1 Tax=Vanrija pseudolonga TaxID=143232 RepID=A0AAF0Y2A8_9TREE|nr:hypothetical protein LOC62_02G002299 [Vanrija pseudolonga]